MHNSFKMIVSTLSLSLLAACGSAPSSSSDIKITNGLAVAEKIFPSVVQIVAKGGVGGCTGTFMNDHQLLTAAHCLDGMTNENLSLAFMKNDETGTLVASALAESFVIHPLYDFNAAMSAYDLAIVNFPLLSSTETAVLKADAAAVGSWLTLVGFGDNVYAKSVEGVIEGSGSGVKRIGTNRLESYRNGLLRIVGQPGPVAGVREGSSVCSGSGDSGAPLLISSEIAGVNIGGGLLAPGGESGEEMQCVSYYVDTNEEHNRLFLEENLAIAAP